jgi:hypothetical protein
MGAGKLKFKEIVPEEAFPKKVIWFEDEGDFNKFAEKADNNEYLFSHAGFMTDENGEEVKVSESQIVFDKESGAYFGFEKQLVSDEKMERLQELADAEEEEPLETTLKKAGVTKQECVDALKEYIETNKETDNGFLHEEEFEEFLLKRIKQLKEIWDNVEDEMLSYLRELTKEKEVNDLILKFMLEKREEKNRLLDEVAKAVIETEEYCVATKEAARKAIITEEFYRRGISDFNADDIMRVKGKAEILLSKARKKI